MFKYAICFSWCAASGCLSSVDLVYFFLFYFDPFGPASSRHPSCQRHVVTQSAPSHLSSHLPCHRWVSYGCHVIDTRLPSQQMDWLSVQSAEYSLELWNIPESVFVILEPCQLRFSLVNSQSWLSRRSRSNRVLRFPRLDSEVAVLPVFLCEKRMLLHFLASIQPISSTVMFVFQDPDPYFCIVLFWSLKMAVYGVFGYGELVRGAWLNDSLDHKDGAFSVSSVFERGTCFTLLWSSLEEFCKSWCEQGIGVASWNVRGSSVSGWELDISPRWRHHCFNWRWILPK